MKHPNEHTPIPKFWRNDFAQVLPMVVSLVVLAATDTRSHAQSVSYDPNVKLTVARDGPELKIQWPAQSIGSNGTAIFPEFEVQYSTNLSQWQPAGERQSGSTAVPNLSFSLGLGTNQPLAFYRLLAVEQPALDQLGSGGAEVFGYGDAFAQALQGIGQISPDQFAAKFPSTATYLPGITWDPTTAQFWDLFDADPEYWLTTPQLAVFMQNGFVVTSETPGDGSFAGVFYDLYWNDLPVFISTDALLEAWHRTYDAMLEEIEETYLFNSVETMLDGMAAQVAAADAVVGNGALHDSLLDADWYLAVARSLLAGTNQPQVPSVLGQDALVAETLAEISSLQLMQVDDFMGFCREVDFSQFQIRGHYTHTARLGCYFQCVMWLGQIDMPVAGGPFERCDGDVRMASPRELGDAIVFWSLLNQSGQFQTWANMEKITSVFVGWTDSLTFGQLNGVLAGAGINTLADVPDVATLSQIQSNLVSGALGVQNIRSDWFESPLGPGAVPDMPQTFTVFGQKFVPDSWAFSETIYDSILWVTNGQTNAVMRRVPGALDAAFAVLGNDQVVPELVEQMKGTFPDTNRPHALLWRDGYPYQHNLAAARAVMDQQTPDAWDSNIYMSWLAGLRELSAPTTDGRYPEAMRTRAWAMKTLNTQLASWAQLRHDTILYANQSYTTGGGGQCLYPTGYIEPRVEFWNRLSQTAARTAELIAGLPYQGSYTYFGPPPPQIDPVTGDEIVIGPDDTNTVPLQTIQDRQVAHLQRFADTAARLADLSAKELAQESFTTNDQQFVGSLVVNVASPGLLGGCGGGPPTYSGWYPKLFYRTIYWEVASFDSLYGSAGNDALIADVNTDVPDLDGCGDPGSVLHEGVGNVNLLLIAVDNGPDHFICAGPVLSHYELELIGPPRRLTDDEWINILEGNFPADVDPSQVEGLAPPLWTTSYFVP